MAKHSLMDCSYSFDDFCNLNAQMSTSSLTCRLQASETSPHEFIAVFNRFFDILSKASSQQVSTPFHLFFQLCTKSCCAVRKGMLFFSCPGRMIANSIPARLVATRMRVVWPRARACPCHARVRLDLPCTCARMCHAQ